MQNQLVIDSARLLYLKHGGRNHRFIEKEMHELGCLRFSRRSLYNQRTKTGLRLGWIERFKWKDQLQTGQSINDNTERAINSPHPALEWKQPPADPDVLVNEPEPAQAPQTSDRQPPTSFREWLGHISPNMTWHWPYQELIYEKLQQVTDGTCKRLMIFLPPRHGKSELVTVRYAAWRLLQDPGINLILGSYNQRLANRFSRKVRITWEDSIQMQNSKLSAENDDNKTNIRDHSCSFVAKEKIATANCQPQTSSGTAGPNSSLPAPHSRRRLNTVAEWETGLGGGLRAVGVGGGITGFGANLAIIDDPVRSRSEAESRTYRDRTYEWFNDDLSTRLEPGGAVILIQTRWHEDDLAGRLLKEMQDGGEHWDVISLPALAEEPDRTEDTPLFMSPKREPILAALADDGSIIPRPVPPAQTRLYHNRDEWKEYDQKLAEYEDLLARQQARAEQEVQECEQERRDNPNPVDAVGRLPGKALCPERFDENELARIRRRLGAYSFSALYQQRPTPPEGGLFKRAWFSRVVDRPPENLRWARAYDLAVSTRSSADFTAAFRCAFDKHTGELYIADGFRRRIEFPEQKRLIVEKMTLEKNTEHGIEEALHGLAFIQELRRDPRALGKPFRGIRPAADKLTRALSWASLAEEGKVILVRGPWIDDFLDEVCTFPNGRHDDQIDAVSLAVQMLNRQKRFAYGF